MHPACCMQHSACSMLLHAASSVQRTLTGTPRLIAVQCFVPCGGGISFPLCSVNPVVLLSCIAHPSHLTSLVHAAQSCAAVSSNVPPVNVSATSPPKQPKLPAEPLATTCLNEFEHVDGLPSQSRQPKQTHNHGLVLITKHQSHSFGNVLYELANERASARAYHPGCDLAFV